MVLGSKLQKKGSRALKLRNDEDEVVITARKQSTDTMRIEETPSSSNNHYSSPMPMLRIDLLGGTKLSQ